MITEEMLKHHYFWRIFSYFLCIFIYWSRFHKILTCVNLRSLCYEFQMTILV